MANAKKIDPLLTTSDVARMLNVHINTVRRWSNQGILKTYRIGSRGDRRFREADIASFLSQESSPAKAGGEESSLSRLSPRDDSKILVDYKV
jgi:excisionase family DNA binding protein